eukprot:PhF_6_TR10978/c0_g2_i4/m.17729
MNSRSEFILLHYGYPLPQKSTQPLHTYGIFPGSNLFVVFIASKLVLCKIGLPRDSIYRYCDELQRSAVMYIVETCREYSDAAYPPLLHRIKSLGKTERDLQRVLCYIRDDAPIIIHVNLDQDDRLSKMTRDGFYRNQFETKTSNGSHPSDRTICSIRFILTQSHRSDPSMDVSTL